MSPRETEREAAPRRPAAQREAVTERLPVRPRPQTAATAAPRNGTPAPLRPDATPTPPAGQPSLAMLTSLASGPAGALDDDPLTSPSFSRPTADSRSYRRNNARSAPRAARPTTRRPPLATAATLTPRLATAATAIPATAIPATATPAAATSMVTTSTADHHAGPRSTGRTRIPPTPIRDTPTSRAHPPHRRPWSPSQSLPATQVAPPSRAGGTARPPMRPRRGTRTAAT